MRVKEKKARQVEGKSGNGPWEKEINHFHSFASRRSSTFALNDQCSGSAGAGIECRNNSPESLENRLNLLDSCRSINFATVWSFNTAPRIWNELPRDSSSKMESSETFHAWNEIVEFSRGLEVNHDGCARWTTQKTPTKAISLTLKLSVARRKCLNQICIELSFAVRNPTMECVLSFGFEHSPPFLARRPEKRLMEESAVTWLTRSFRRLSRRESTSPFLSHRYATPLCDEKTI